MRGSGLGTVGADWEATSNLFEETTSYFANDDWDRKVREFSQGQGRLDWSVPEAFLAVLIGAAQSDLEVTIEEQDELRGLRKRARILKSLTPEQAKKANENAQKKLRERGDTGLKEACHCLPNMLRMPVFALALDLVLADGKVTESEKAFINKIAEWLEIDSGAARQIRHVMLIKNNC